MKTKKLKKIDIEFIKKLNINNDMKTFFIFFTFDIEENLKDEMISKYLLQIKNDYLIFKEGLQTFNFYDKKEEGEYYKYYKLIIDNYAN